MIATEPVVEDGAVCPVLKLLASPWIRLDLPSDCLRNTLAPELEHARKLRGLDWVVRTALPALIPREDLAASLSELPPLDGQHWEEAEAVMFEAFEALEDLEGPPPAERVRDHARVKGTISKLSYRASMVRRKTGIAGALLAARPLHRGMPYALATATTLAACWDTWPDWPTETVEELQASLRGLVLELCKEGS